MTDPKRLLRERDRPGRRSSSHSATDFPSKTIGDRRTFPQQRSIGMNSLKNVPRLSLLLLLIAYTILGWFIADSTTVWRNWVWASLCAESVAKRSLTCAFLTSQYVPWTAVSLAIILVTLGLIHPIAKIKSVFGNWLQSDAKAFLSAIAFAFFVVIFVTRSDLLVESIGLIAPGLLARLELQLAGYNDKQSFGILTVIALVGYSLGLFLHQNWNL